MPEPNVADPIVTIIVPAWGAAEFVGETLASLQAQTRSDWRAMVIDDGDRRLAAALAPFAADRRIRLLETDNGGPSAARNRGIAASATPFVSMLDGDDRYRADYLERMLAAFAADPGLAFVTCDAIMFGSPAFEGRIFSHAHPQTEPITLERVIRRQFNVCGGSMVRREVMEQVGGYDERLRSAEDFDLWIRILEQGGRGGLVPAPLIEYRRRAGSLSASSAALARYDVQNFAQAAERLAGRPEQAAAREMLAKAENQLRIEEGLAQALAGRTREGVALLRRTDLARRSLKWRLAMTLFHMVPALAGPVLRLYMRGHPFGGGGKAASS